MICTVVALKTFDYPQDVTTTKIRNLKM